MQDDEGVVLFHQSSIAATPEPKRVTFERAARYARDKKTRFERLLTAGHS